jgi:tetratricopeptide (TPR) repeat protein
VAGLALVLVGGALYLSDRSDPAGPPATDDVRRSSPAVASQAASKPPATFDDLQAPSPVDTDRVARLLGDARRLAYDGRFSEAKEAIDNAEAIFPGSPEIAQLRREVADISKPEAQFALQLQRARSAIAQGDHEGAEKALAAAERLNPQAPEIARLRQELQAAEQKQAERSHRIAALLGEMRQAIARRDLAAAGRALNEAERLDVRDPAIDPARIELAHAQDAERKAQQ